MDLYKWSSRRQTSIESAVESGGLFNSKLESIDKITATKEIIKGNLVYEFLEDKAYIYYPNKIKITIESQIKFVDEPFSTDIQYILLLYRIEKMKKNLRCVD